MRLPRGSATPSAAKVLEGSLHVRVGMAKRHENSGRGVRSRQRPAVQRLRQPFPQVTRQGRESVGHGQPGSEKKAASRSARVGTTRARSR